MAAASFVQEVIDGSKTPWLIPDSQAYQALFNILSATGKSSLDAKTKIAWLTEGGVGKEDAAIAIEVAAAHSERTKVIKSKSGSGERKSSDRYVALAESIAELHRRVSPEASKRLVQLVQGLKKNMRSFRGSSIGHEAGAEIPPTVR
ncbi:MAG: hypothetical protein U0Q16_11255 [Bryobacteraceae bacterium]